jgi:ATP-dependent DNA helicase DinG
LSSPFDYKKQVCIYIPKHIADPREDDFAKLAAVEAAALIEITGGGALVLCTSLRNMKEIHEELGAAVEGPLLLQGEAPKSLLLKKFKEDPRSVLCATASFWQGVDLPGDALRLVIIDKLPFDSPADPLTSARIAHIQDQGKNPFSTYQVPNAILALKQGFGRLIRTRSDRGIVAILDNRLHTRSYRRSFLRSLPECTLMSDLDEVSSWWLGQPTPSRKENS